MFYKKGVLVNFAKFTGKYLCQSLFFNKTDAQHSHSYFRRTLSKTITNVYLTDWIFSYLSEVERKSKFRRNSFYRRNVAFYKDLTRSRNSFQEMLSVLPLQLWSETRRSCEICLNKSKGQILKSFTSWCYHIKTDNRETDNEAGLFTLLCLLL